MWLFISFYLLQVVLGKVPGLHENEIILLSCPRGCPVLIQPTPPKWTELYPGWLIVNVTINDGKVFLNKYQIWPELSNYELYAYQVTDGDIYVPYSDKIPIEASVIHKPTTTWKDQVIYPVDIRIKKLLNKGITAEGITVEIVKSPTGSITFETIKLLPYSSTKTTCSCSGGKCKLQQTPVDRFETYMIESEDEINCTMESQEPIGFKPEPEQQVLCRGKAHSSLLNEGFWLFSFGLVMLIGVYVVAQVKDRIRIHKRYSVDEKGQDTAALLGRQ